LLREIHSRGGLFEDLQGSTRKLRRIVVISLEGVDSSKYVKAELNSKPFMYFGLSGQHEESRLSYDHTFQAAREDNPEGVRSGDDAWKLAP